MSGLLRELVRPRYAALTALMVVVAAICIGAGTWQIFRYDGKHVANDDLRTNAADATVAVGQVLPTAGGRPTPGRDDVEFRTVTASGTYDARDQVLVRRQQVDDRVGYFVLTPLRTDSAVLLVVRGFVPDTTADLGPGEVPAPPIGPVTVTGRVQTGSGDDDKFAALGNGQVTVINPAAASERLGATVYAGYVELEDDQPGTAGLTPIPAPDMSNPAGGAFELQHLAYIVQWYLFAGLALAAPIVMVRTDRRRAQDDEDATATRPGIDDGTDAVDAPTRTAAERLAERYGR